MVLNKHRKGQVWLVDLDPSKVDEVGKKRPALIFQDDKLNSALNSTVIIPFSSQIVPDSEPLRIHFSPSFLDMPSDLVINQITAVSNTRLLRYLGTLAGSDMLKISQYIKIVLSIK